MASGQGRRYKRDGPAPPGATRWTTAGLKPAQPRSCFSLFHHFSPDSLEPGSLLGAESTGSRKIQRTSLHSGGRRRKRLVGWPTEPLSPATPVFSRNQQPAISATGPGLRHTAPTNGEEERHVSADGRPGKAQKAGGRRLINAQLKRCSGGPPIDNHIARAVQPTKREHCGETPKAKPGAKTLERGRISPDSPGGATSEPPHPFPTPGSQLFPVRSGRSPVRSGRPLHVFSLGATHVTDAAPTHPQPTGAPLLQPLKQYHSDHHLHPPTHHHHAALRSTPFSASPSPNLFVYSVPPHGSRKYCC
ncbi:hypothetical protein B0J13DRAFT_258048 [Dactylonectria estremocensis]|uniref:Uncharacterized protein n=1 Tax=Dactylonectria estremocensis TaxID=1079267 RepID=A0A9P9F3G1_9HYPO|nr:hypothetical protein B0J13DRAFT_258048 [Dactylonectria estremocensis]